MLSCQIMPAFQFLDNKVILLLLDVIYESSLPETYQLHIMFLTGPAAKTYSENFPAGIIANLTIGETKGILCDAL